MFSVILFLLAALDMTILEFNACFLLVSADSSALTEEGKSRLCERGGNVPAGGVRADKYLYWSNPPSSGLGDRMINLLAAQTIAWYECKTLFLIWPPSSKAGKFPTYSSLFEVTPGLVVVVEEFKADAPLLGLRQ